MKDTANFRFYFIMVGMFVFVINSFLQLFGDTQNLYVVIFNWINYGYVAAAFAVAFIETKNRKRS